MVPLRLTILLGPLVLAAAACQPTAPTATNAATPVAEGADLVGAKAETDIDASALMAPQ
ncbi:hypothetical protein [Tropicimonas sp. IMCC34043]|uniref:hypothetical protein n=1 Tax=Tropicimonas sp. IMCC34043 TaxID=2248760 RepID=UPI0013002134|nr:hypothetical protein [Tropicimonas sp. IMCC34043]